MLILHQLNYLTNKFQSIKKAKNLISKLNKDQYQMIKIHLLLKLENLQKTKEMKNFKLKKENLQIHKLKVKNQNLKIKNQDQGQDQYLEIIVFKENCHKYHRI